MSEVAAPAISQSTIDQSRSPGFVVDIVVLGCFALLVGGSFWKNWFSETDSLVCSVCLAIGLIVALIRGIAFEPIYRRPIAPWVFYGCAMIVVAYALVAARPKLSGIAAGLIAAGWFSHRLRGESLSQAVCLGFAFMIPSVVDACDQRGAFDFVERCAVNLTSGLAEAANQFHVQSETSIEFGHGIADRFSSVGRWDSILTFVGISFLCIYIFRRPLLPAVLTCSMAFFVWMAVRAAAWVTFSWYAERNTMWPEWTLTIEIVLFGIGAVLILMLDQFFATLLAPIPDEYINEDLPLVAMCWNWMVSLPSLRIVTPDRTVPDSDDYMSDSEDS
jgi:hypothetical protein